MNEGERLNEDMLLQDDDATSKKYTIDQAFDKIGGYSKIENDCLTRYSL